MLRQGRNVLIAIGIAWWAAITCAGFLAYFVTRPCDTGVCDGLGRELTLTPTFVRLLLHTDRLWAGWEWSAIEMAVMWASVIVSYLALESGDANTSDPGRKRAIDVAASGKPSVLPAEFAGKQEIISAIAARADDRHDITFEPEEEGWSIRVKGEVAMLVNSSVIGRQLLEDMKSLVDARKQETSAFPSDQT